MVDPAGRKPSEFILCEHARAFGRHQHVLAVHDGVPIDVNDYQSWRFSTYRWDFRCQYYEIWEAIDERMFVYELDKAYLTLFQVYRTRPPDEVKLLALHCDPGIDDTEPHAIYKRGPHLHMDFAQYPLPRAHIALNRGHLAEVLRSVGDLSDAIAAAVMMLKEQVLELDWPSVA